MSDGEITLRNFAATFVNKVVQVDLPDCHPAGAVTINGWLDHMIVAAEDGDAPAVARLATWVADKIEQERAWYRESCGG